MSVNLKVVLYLKLTMPTRVYCDGVFDLFHIGHVGFLQEVRRKAMQENPDAQDIHLIVGVIADADVLTYKRLPVTREHHRAAAVAACRWVDETIPNAPLVVTEDFLTEHHIDLVFHGDDSKQEGFFAVPIARGIMRYCTYDPEQTGISTTGLIATIKARDDL
jgi:choline-phosphate cytidylyltransferase